MNMKLIAAVALTAALIASCEKKNGGSTESKDPSAPSGVVLVQGSETATSLTFKWDEVPGATSYGWRLMKGSEEAQTGGGTNRSARITGLTAGMTYKFYVRSIWSGGESDWSAPVEATTKESGGGGGGDDPDVPVSEEVYAEFMIEDGGDSDTQAYAFPGAEGGGMLATGGRGGRILHVTTLDDNSSEGSLRWACTQDFPRIIVFDVAGVIALNSKLTVTKDNCTIAGQTAPGAGICIKNYTFAIAANNVVVRFMRFRMGDDKKTEDDALQIMNHTDDSYSGIIIDHCSVSWSTDECASFYGMKDFTFQWNIVSESLRNSVHDKGAHGYGGIWGGNNATYHHNLLAHHDSRNPRLDHDYVSTQKGPVSIVNNVVYNWDGNSCYGGESSSKNGSDYRKYNFFGNYYKPGPRTPSNHLWLIQPTTSCSNCGGTIIPGHFFLADNILHGQDAVTSNNWKTQKSSPTGVYADAGLASSIKNETPFPIGSGLSIHSASGAFDAVLDSAGASFVRDAVDERVCRETREGSFTYSGSNTEHIPSGSNRSDKGLIDTQTDVGGWPNYSATAEEIDHNFDSDGDGMPDWFEEKYKLKKTSASDGNAKNLDIKGRYTNVEMYMHYLVKEIVSGGNAAGDFNTL